MQERRGGRLIVRGITFERAQLVRLDALATRQRRSRSYVVRDAVDDALDRYERDADARTRTRR